MHLKSLKAEGFKSFADKIELKFDGDITTIVGPNGSGKSNISDAVRWVLGEQSAKSLRGSKMEDVIFGGTQKRSKMGFAEVVLTLDNHDKLFNSNFDELVISRKVYASGESQYMINGATCRLRDIHEVFMDTGVGRDGYSMIGQGKVEEILSSKSEDRRVLFEEAAGISKYRYKKDEAERKLAHTEDNITRLSDIIAELESQVGPLEAQSKKAKKYLELKEELKVYEVNSAINIVEKNKEAVKKVIEDIGIVTEHLSKTKDEIAGYDAQQEEVYAIFKEYDEKIAELEKMLRDIEVNNGILKSESGIMAGTIDSNKMLIERICAENDETNAKITNYKQELVSFDEEKTKIKKEIDEIETEIIKLQQEKDADVDNSEQTAIAEELQEKIIASVNAISELKIKLSNSELMMQNYCQKKESLLTDIDKKSLELNGASQKLEDLKKERDEVKNQMKDDEDKLSSLLTLKDEISNKIDILKKEYDDSSVLLTQKRTRHKMLEDMEQNFSGYPKSVRFLMKAYENGELNKAKIYGPLSKLFDVEKEYITAIEVALGGAIQNIVVEDENDAKIAIEYLKRAKIGRATFMPVSAVRAKDFEYDKVKFEKGFVSIASDLIRTDSKYYEIVRSLLSKCVVVSTIDDGIAISRKYKNDFKIVTLSGELLNKGGTMSGGYISETSNILGREQEIVELSADIIELEKSNNKLKDELFDLSKQFEKTKEQADDLSFDMSDDRMLLAEISKDIEHNEIVLKDYNNLIENLSKDAIANEKAEREQSEQRDEFANKISIEEIKITEARQKLSEIEKALSDVIFRKEILADTIVEKTMQKSSLLKDITVLDDKKADKESEISQAITNIELKQTEINDINEKNQQLSYEISLKDEQLKASSKESEKLLSKIEDCKKIKHDHEENSKAVQILSKESRDKVYALTEECGRLESRKEKLESEVDSAVSRLWDEYEITYSETEKYKQDLGGITVVNKVISEIRGKIRALGNINVDAIEEYKAVSERYEFLTGQRADLQKAKNDLTSIITEMLKVMESRFREEFEKINKHFKTTFVELFGGGTAELSLDDPLNILESAININVQPPGKKLQSLMLLSGGERALSAIALLFAIIKIRPTPFCFLDEIEAALDEANVYRFAEYIKTYSKQTQFILITHRRGTMECADTIYGITMQEKGVSKLLKLSLGEIT